MKKPKEKLFKCSCGSPYCGKLLAILFDDGQIELNWVKHKRKKPSEGVIIEIKELKKLIGGAEKAVNSAGIDYPI